MGNLRSSGAFRPPLRPWRPRKLPSRLPMAMALPAGTSGSELQAPAPCWRHHGALKRPAALRCPPLPKRRRPQRHSARTCRAPCGALVLPRVRPGSPAALAWLYQCLPCHSLQPGGLAVPPRVLRPPPARLALRAAGLAVWGHCKSLPPAAARPEAEPAPPRPGLQHRGSEAEALLVSARGLLLLRCEWH